MLNEIKPEVKEIKWGFHCVRLLCKHRFHNLIGFILTH